MKDQDNTQKYKIINLNLLRHRIDIFKGYLLRKTPWFTHFSQIVPSKIQPTANDANHRSGAIYLGAEPLKIGKYNAGHIKAKIAAENTHQPRGLTFFTILENFELEDRFSDQAEDSCQAMILETKNKTAQQFLKLPLAHEATNQRIQLSLPDYIAFTEKNHEIIKRFITLMHQERHDKKNDIYIHCKAGVGRSMSILLCYLTIYEHDGCLDIAYNQIKKERWFVSAKSSPHYAAVEKFCTEYFLKAEDYTKLFNLKREQIFNLLENIKKGLQQRANSGYQSNNGKIQHIVQLESEINGILKTRKGKINKKDYEDLEQLIQNKLDELNNSSSVMSQQRHKISFFHSHSQPKSAQQLQEGLSKILPNCAQQATPDAIKVTL